MKIEEIILNWIGEDKYHREIESDMYDSGYNQALKDMRDTVHMLVYNLESTKLERQLNLVNKTQYIKLYLTNRIGVKKWEYITNPYNPFMVTNNNTGVIENVDYSEIRADDKGMYIFREFEY